MLILNTRTPWRRRPSGLVEIDRSSHQANGLLALWSATPQGFYTDMATHRTSTTATNVVTACPLGGYAVNVAAANATNCGARTDLSAVSAITLCAWVGEITASGSDTRIVQIGDKGTSPFVRYALEWGGSSFRVETNDGASAVSTASGLGAIVWENWHHACAVISSVERVVYVNGVKGTSGAGVTTATTTDDCSIGYSTAFTNYFPGKIADVRIYNRALSSAEIYALYDPSSRWSAYTPVVNRTYMFVGSSGGGGGTRRLSAGIVG